MYGQSQNGNNRLAKLNNGSVTTGADAQGNANQKKMRIVQLQLILHVYHVFYY